MYNKVKENIINFTFGAIPVSIIVLMSVIFYTYEQFFFYSSRILVIIIIVSLITVIGREFRSSIKRK